MPWITDENGEQKYKLSVFAKEELPTWNEIYNDYYKAGNVCSYDAEDADDQALDVYWKVPRKKVLLATMCNQLNKMLLEDHKLTDPDMTELLDMIRPANELELLGFTLRGSVKIDKYSDEDFTLTDDPRKTIYTIPFPNGKENELLPKSDMNRVNVNDISHMELALYISEVGQTESGDKWHAFGEYKPNTEFFKAVIDMLLRDVIMYYEGEDIGWKDENGNLISRP